MNSEKKRAMKNVVIVFSTAPISSLINFFMTLLVARYLLSEGFGVYSTILSIVSIFGVFIEGGRTLIVRNIARAPEQLRDIFGVTKGLLWTLSLVGFVGIMIVMRFNDNLVDLPAATYLIAGLATLGTYHAFGHGIVFLATERMEVNAFGRLFSKLLALVLVSLAVYFSLTLTWILASIATANLALWWFYHAVFKKHYGSVATVLEWRKILDLFRQITAVGSISIVRNVTWNIDILMLTWLATVNQTGIFNGAYNIVVSINMIPIFAGLVFFPMMSRMGQKNSEKLLSRVRKYLVIFFLLAVPLLAVFFLYVDRIILLLLGEHYLGSIPVMKILAVDVLFSFPISMFLYVFVAMNMQKLFLLGVTVGLVVNGILDLFLIADMGAIGAAYGTLSADVICFIILVVVQYRFRHEDQP